MRIFSCTARVSLKLRSAMRNLCLDCFFLIIFCKLQVVSAAQRRVQFFATWVTGMLARSKAALQLTVAGFAALDFQSRSHCSKGWYRDFCVFRCTFANPFGSGVHVRVLIAQ